MLVLHSRLKFGERAFIIAAPRAWNSLPADLRATVNTGTHLQKETEDAFILQILYNFLLNFIMLY